MPELPEVETVARALDAALRGRELRGAELLGRMRLPFDAAEATRRLKGRKILGVRRRAKYLVFHCEGDAWLLAHLGMTGTFRLEKGSVPKGKHDRAIFRLKGGDELRYADARRFGFVGLTDAPAAGGVPAELDRLGPEPLDRKFNARAMAAKAKGRKTPIKVFIMDQRTVAGVGNIYAVEALFGAGIDPRRPASALDAGEWRRLAAQIKAVLRGAIEKGGSTIRSYRTVDGTEGGFQRRLRVYGRAGEACPGCGGGIEVTRQGGRSTFFCPACQR